jgi:hypothetical protein
MNSLFKCDYKAKNPNRREKAFSSAFLNAFKNAFLNEFKKLIF